MLVGCVGEVSLQYSLLVLFLLLGMCRSASKAEPIYFSTSRKAGRGDCEDSGVSRCMQDPTRTKKD